MEQVIHEIKNVSLLQDPKHKTRNLFFVFSLIALTGFEFFFRSVYLWIPLFLYSGYFFLMGRKKIDKYFIYITIPFLIVKIFQAVVFNNLTLPIGFLINFFTYYFIATLVGRGFIHYFIKILLFFSATSLFFWFLEYNDIHYFILDNIAPYFPALNKEFTIHSNTANILIHNFFLDRGDIIRNSGPFWEPGLFVGFIAIALFFNLYINKKIFSVVNVTFIVTIITTFSSTGYILLFIILFSYFLFSSKSKIKYLVVPFMIILSVFVYANTEFMKTKIEYQYGNAKDDNVNRFGAMLVHMQMLERSPIIGYLPTDQEYSMITDAHALANGLSNVLVVWGIPASILYYILLGVASVQITSIYVQKRLLGVVFFLILITFAFSQDVTTRHLYYFFIIWSITQYNQLKNKITKQNATI